MKREQTAEWSALDWLLLPLFLAGEDQFILTEDQNDREPRPRLLVLVLESVSTMQSTRGQLQPSNIRALSHAIKDNITCCSLVFGMSTDV